MAGRAGEAVARAAAFWDASALVPLCVRQSITASATLLYRNYAMVIWWATPVEIASALARLVRMKHLAPSDVARAGLVTKILAQSWSVIQPCDALRLRATQLVEGYDLSAADALQLAAALQWCEELPQGHVLLTADQRLREAALLNGFNCPVL